MKLLIPIIIALTTTLEVCAQRGASFQPKNPRQPFEVVDAAALNGKLLNKEITQEVSVSLGYTTYLQFPKGAKIDRVNVGADKLIMAVVDEDLNSITLNPLVVNGHTNMLVVIQGVPYNFEIHIVPQGQIDFRLTYNVPTPGTGANVRFGPPVVPDQIDTNAYIRSIESNAKIDENSGTEYQEVSKSYTWNNSLIYLTDVFGYPRDNMIVVRIHRRNVSSNINYLHVDQIRACVGNVELPTTAAVQSRAELLPGQMEKIYLFIQGYNLHAFNDFRIKLPPQATDLQNLR